jgi:general stress protein YciG
MSLNLDGNISQLTVKVAGARGGISTFYRHGKRHFQEIGRKGQASLSAKVSSEQRRSWGALGGRPRKRRLFVVGEKGKQD